jgi:hypothetical protein
MAITPGTLPASSRIETTRRVVVSFLVRLHALRSKSGYWRGAFIARPPTSANFVVIVRSAPMRVWKRLQMMSQHGLRVPLVNASSR